MKRVIVILLLLLCIKNNFVFCQYLQPFFPYFSQGGQDKYLVENIFRDKKKGVFFDIGAHDGVSYSNSYYFEKELGWSGICVEPQEDIYQKLQKNRSCFCIQGCVYNQTGFAQFLQVNGPSEMLSGLLDTYDPKHHERVDHEIALLGGSKEIFKVTTYTFNDLCEKFNIIHFDFVSIDTEGSEESIVKSIDFNKITIDVFSIENNYKENGIEEFLISKGYELYHKIGPDDIYLRKEAKKQLNI